jgi:hypothetical protein
MSGCIDKELGQLLHDYELGLLSDEDTHRFEMHLYDCEYCLAQVREFMDVSRILSEDHDAHALIESIASSAETEKHRKNISPFLKILIAAVLLVVIAVPVYRYAVYEKHPVAIQTLELMPTRAGGSDVIYLKKGGDVDIGFFVNPSFQGHADIVITDLAGDTAWYKHNFTNINGHGLGKITLPVSSFSEGHYIFILRPVNDTVQATEVQYMFRVK